jgi:Holliday junction DNA helicase RuvA
MISFIKGKLISFSPAHVVIETNGIGYKILTPTNLFPHLPNIQQDVTLYTSDTAKQ